MSSIEKAKLNPQESKPLPSEPQPKISDLMKFVWKTYPRAGVTELPALDGSGLRYGIIDRARVQNVELSDLHVTDEAAWLDAANRLGFSQLAAKLSEPVEGDRLNRTKQFLELVMMAARIEECDRRSKKQDDWDLRHYRTLSRPSAVIGMWNLIGQLFDERDTAETMHAVWRKRAEEAELRELNTAKAEKVEESPDRFNEGIEAAAKWAESIEAGWSAKKIRELKKRSVGGSR